VGPESACANCRLGYEKELIGVLEGLVRDMDRKIERQKERADKESAPKALTDADRAKLDEILARQKGALLQEAGCGQVPQRPADVLTAPRVPCGPHMPFRCMAEAATSRRRAHGGRLSTTHQFSPATLAHPRGSQPQLSQGGTLPCPADSPKVALESTGGGSSTGGRARLELNISTPPPNL
jgi:hypothetical protein